MKKKIIKNMTKDSLTKDHGIIRAMTAEESMQNFESNNPEFSNDENEGNWKP